MARNREALVLLLDVGPSMHNALPEVEKICSMLVEKKFIYGKSDEVGLVVFGTQETNNELTTEVGGYDHIAVLRNIKVVDGDLVDALQHLPRGTVNGDYLDAIIVGMDMMIKKYRETFKGKKRLCLITNAQCPIKDPFEGTKEDQVNTIAAQMTAHGMKMENIVVRGRLSQNADMAIMDENDRLLNLFPKKARARTVYVESSTSLLGALKTRNIAPVTVYRGDLEISPTMKIKVWVYKKTQEEKFPTLKKYSDKAPATDKFATHEVKVDYEYKSLDNKVVPPEQRIKGYRYGPQVIPISSDVLEAFKFKPEKGVKLLGFTDSTEILRHYYMKDVYMFIAEPGNSRASLAVSAIARAMKDMNKVAILRCVWRQGQQSVVVGVLTPNLSTNEKVPDSFFFNVLPFAEDIREFQFPSLSSFPASWLPNDRQQEAADQFVQMLDLAPSGKEELLPDHTPNPVLERFYRHLELKSKQPDAAVPPLDETLKRITEPDPELVSRNKPAIDAICKCFEVKDNPKNKKKSRRSLRDKPSASSDEDRAEDVSDAQTVKSIEKAPDVKVEKIGDLTPIEDFNSMLSRRDGPEWVVKAIRDMKHKISLVVEDCFKDELYPKAVELLIALRKGCILEQEPKEFNDFLRHLCQICESRGDRRFFQHIASNDVTLIPKSEAADSDVSNEEARSFLVKTEPKPESF